MFGHTWRPRVVSDDVACRGVDQGQARSLQNMRSEFDEIAPVSTKVVSGTNHVLFKHIAKRPLVL